MRCLREADAIADAGGGTVGLDPDLKQKKLVDLGGDVVARAYRSSSCRTGWMEWSEHESHDGR